ncbi:MAG: hypothetical protein KL787_06020 [Taibaiella sp.]|nr:hypothetical protein [Taibaiella sp.]
MKLKLKEYCRSALVMSLVIILCIPCQAKREIKSQLHIPVAGQAIKTGPLQICTAIPRGRPASAFSLKVLQRELPSHKRYAPQAGLSVQSEQFTARHPLRESPAIPLHILYQQFLI